jgi:hypothetical protein
VKIVAADRVVGAVVVESFEREHAFGDSEVRLLQTIVASMGVALENARLFDETQRLLKETEQRNAELAVINAIQQGMSRSLDFRAIIDLVGASSPTFSAPATSASAGSTKRPASCNTCTRSSTASASSTGRGPHPRARCGRGLPKRGNRSCETRATSSRRWASRRSREATRRARRSACRCWSATA